MTTFTIPKFSRRVPASPPYPVCPSKKEAGYAASMLQYPASFNTSPKASPSWRYSILLPLYR